MANVRRVVTDLAGTQIVGGGISTAYFPEENSAADCVDAMQAFWASVGVAMCSGNTVLVRRDTELIDLATGQITGIETGGTVSTISGANTSPMGPALQGLIRWRTGTYLGGRELRGRTFIPAVSESSCDAGVPNSGIITVWQNAANALIGDTATALSVYSKTKSARSAVASASVWNQFAVLRRRRD